MKTKYYEKIFSATCPICKKNVLRYDVDGVESVEVTPCNHLVFAFEDAFSDYTFKRSSHTSILNATDEDEFKALAKEFNLSLEKHIGPYNPCGTPNTFLGFKKY